MSVKARWPAVGWGRLRVAVTPWDSVASAETVRVSSLHLGQVSGQKDEKMTAVWKGDGFIFLGQDRRLNALVLLDVPSRNGGRIKASDQQQHGSLENCRVRVADSYCVEWIFDDICFV